MLRVAVFVLLSLIWGTTWAAISVGLRGIPPFTGVAARFAIASAALLVIAPLLGARIGAHGAVERRLWVANGLLSFFASYGIVYWCEQRIPSGLAAVLFATFPLFVQLLAHAFLPEERMTWRAGIGALVGFAGVAVIFSEDLASLGGPGVALGAAVMLGAPFVSAISNVALKRWGAGIHPISLAAVPMGIAACAMVPMAWIFERGRPVILDASSVGAVLYLAIAGSAVTFTLYYWLMSHLPATRIALIAYLVPVFAVLVGAVALHEPLTPRIVAGSALVLAGTALATSGLGKGKETPRPSRGSDGADPKGGFGKA